MSPEGLTPGPENVDKEADQEKIERLSDEMKKAVDIAHRAEGLDKKLLEANDDRSPKVKELILTIVAESTTAFFGGEPDEALASESASVLEVMCDELKYDSGIRKYEDAANIEPSETDDETVEEPEKVSPADEVYIQEVKLTFIGGDGSTLRKMAEKKLPELCESWDTDPVGLANIFAEKGWPEGVIKVVEFTDIPQSERLNLLATAYEKEADREEDPRLGEAEIARSANRVKELRKKAEIIRK